MTPAQRELARHALGMDEQTIDERIEAARNELMRLERLKEAKSCAEGHSWVFTGGCNAGCNHRTRGEDCVCSAPVHECSVCGDCDYGENDEAREIVARCKERHHV